MYVKQREQVNRGVDHVTASGGGADLSNDDDTSSKHSDPNICDYRVTITVRVLSKL